MLHDFGGRRSLFGDLDLIATKPIDALNAPGSTMIGMGLTPEAIEQNPMSFLLLTILPLLIFLKNV